MTPNKLEINQWNNNIETIFVGYYYLLNIFVCLCKLPCYVRYLNLVREEKVILELIMTNEVKCLFFENKFVLLS